MKNKDFYSFPTIFSLILALTGFFIAKTLFLFDDIVSFRIFIVFLIIFSFLVTVLGSKILYNLEKSKEIEKFLKMEIDDEIKSSLKKLGINVLNEEENSLDIKKLKKLKKEDFEKIYSVFKIEE